MLKHKPHSPEGDQPKTDSTSSSSHSTAAHDESNWLVSYADMMTLLCGFFIMLFSMSKLDEPQYDSFKQEIVKHFGGEYVSPSQQLANYATQVIQELGIETTTTIKSDPTGISIIFESTVFFDTLSAEVKPQGKTILNRMIDEIKGRQAATSKNYKIVVEGHTDERPIVSGMYPSNWELSAARASRVVRMFLQQGFSSDHLTAIGYADTHPQAVARTPSGSWDEAALAKNRRVVLRILEPKVDAIPFPDTARPPTPPLGTDTTSQKTANSAH